MTLVDDYGMGGFSFTSAPPKFTRDLQLIFRGPEKAGKTWLPLMTAPEPVVYLNGDRNNDRLIQWALERKRKLIVARPYFYKLPGTVLIRTRMDASVRAEIEEKNKAEVLPRWKRWLNEYRAALYNPKIATIVIDTGGWVYDTLRIAKYGTLTIPQHLAPEYKSEMAALIQEAEGSGKLVIWIHREASEYEKFINDKGEEDSRQTGRMKTKGYAEFGNCVSGVLSFGFDFDMSGETPGLTGDGKRYVKVESGIRGRGMVLKGAKLTVPEIAALITKTEAKVWL